MNQFTPFDASDYLDNEDTIAEYLTAALEDVNPDVFLAAIADVAKVPILKVLHGLGVKLVVAV